MDYKSILYALAVAETGSFIRAAEKVSLTQSAISRSIIALEKELGIALFDRSISGVTVTPAGQVFMQRARNIMDEVQALKQEVAEYQSELSGLVTIGISPTLAISHLAPLLSHSISHLPKVKINVHIDIWSSYCEALRRGDIDFAIDSRRSISNEIDINITNISTFRGIGVFCRRDHPLTKFSSVTPQQLRNYPMVAGGLDKTLENIYRGFMNIGKDTPLNVPLVCDSLQVLQQVVADTDALMTTSPDAVQGPVKSGELVELPIRYATPIEPGQMVIVTTKGRSLSTAAQNLIDKFLELNRPVA